MKRFFGLALALILTLSLTACGVDDSRYPVPDCYATKYNYLTCYGEY